MWPTPDKKEHYIPMIRALQKKFAAVLVHGGNFEVHSMGDSTMAGIYLFLRPTPISNQTTPRNVLAISGPLGNIMSWSSLVPLVNIYIYIIQLWQVHHVAAHVSAVQTWGMAAILTACLLPVPDWCKCSEVRNWMDAYHMPYLLLPSLRHSYSPSQMISDI